MENIGQIHSAVAGSTTTGRGKAKAGSLFATLMAALRKGLKTGVDGKIIKDVGKQGQAGLLTKEADRKKLAPESLLFGKNSKKNAQTSGRKHDKDNTLGALGIAMQPGRTELARGVTSKGTADKSHTSKEHLKILTLALQNKNNGKDQPGVRKSLAEMIKNIERKNISGQTQLNNRSSRQQSNITKEASARAVQQEIAHQGKAQNVIHISTVKGKQTNTAADGQNAKALTGVTADTRETAAEKVAQAVRMEKSATTKTATGQHGKSSEDSLQTIMATAAKAEKHAAQVQQSTNERADKAKKFALLKAKSSKAISAHNKLVAQAQVSAQVQPQPEIKAPALHSAPLPASHASVDVSMTDDAGTIVPQASNGNSQMSASVQGFDTSATSARVYTANAPTPPAAPNAGPWTVMMAMQEIGLQAMQGKTQLELRLEPAHLGKMRVFLKSDSQKKIQIHMVVDQNVSRQLIEQHMPMLRHSLEQQGLNLGNFSMSGQQHQGADKREQQAASDALPTQAEHSINTPNIQPIAARIPSYTDGHLSIHI